MSTSPPEAERPDQPEPGKDEPRLAAPPDTGSAPAGEPSAPFSEPPTEEPPARSAAYSPSPEQPRPDRSTPAGSLVSSGQPSPYPVLGYPSYPGDHPTSDDSARDRPGYPSEYSPPKSDPLVATNFGGWLRRILTVVRRDFPPLAMLLAIALAAWAVISGLFGFAFLFVEDRELLVMLLGFIAMAAAVAIFAMLVSASMFVIIRDAAGHRPAPAEVLWFAIDQLPTLLGWMLLAGVLLFLGFALLVLPGLYLAVVASAALAGVVVVERAGITRCFALVTPRFLPTLGRLAVALLVVSAYLVALAMISEFFGVAGPIGFAISLILQLALSVPLGVFGMAVITVTYAELRGHEDPATTVRWLAAELNRR